MNVTYLEGSLFELKNRDGVICTEPLKINDVAIENAGEYEVGGIYCEVLDGITLFSFEEIHIAYLGHRKKPLTDEEAEKMNNIDILFLPIGGGDVFSVREALEVSIKIEPKVIIPMLYKEEDLAEFCKQGGTVCPEQEVYKISKNNLPQEERQIIILKPKGK